MQHHHSSFLVAASRRAIYSHGNIERAHKLCTHISQQRSLLLFNIDSSSIQMLRCRRSGTERSFHQACTTHNDTRLKFHHNDNHFHHQQQQQQHQEQQQQQQQNTTISNKKNAKWQLISQFQSDPSRALMQLLDMISRRELLSFLSSSPSHTSSSPTLPPLTTSFEELSDTSEFLNDIFDICASKRYEKGVLTLFDLIQKLNHHYHHHQCQQYQSKTATVYHRPQFQVTIDHYNKIMSVLHSGERVVFIFENLLRNYMQSDSMSSLKNHGHVGSSSSGHSENMTMAMMTNSHNGSNIDRRIVPNQESLRLMLQAAHRSKMDAEAIHMFNTILERRIIVPCVSTFTQVMHMYATRGQMRDALNTFMEMQVRQLVPSVVTYSVLMKGFLDFSNHGHNLRYHHSHNHGDGSGSTVSMSSTIMNKLPHLVVHDEAREQIASEFLSYGLVKSWIDLLEKPNPPIIRMAYELFEFQRRMHHLNGDSSIMPDTYTFNIMIDGLVKNRKFRQVQEFVELMKEHDIRMDRTTLGTLIKCYLAQDKVDEAERLIQERSLLVHVSSFNTLMSHQLKRFKRDKRDKGAESLLKVLRYFKQMVHTYQLRPDAFTCSLLIETYCLMGKPKYAYSIYEQMRRGRRNDGNSNHYHQIHSHSNDNNSDDYDSVDGEYDQFMVRLPCRVPCNVVTYELLIYYLRDQAKPLFLTMLHEDQLLPSESVMNTMSQILKVDDVYALWSAVRKKFPGIRPNMKTIAIIYARGVGTLNTVQSQLRVEQPVSRLQLLQFLIHHSTDQMLRYVLRIMNRERGMSFIEYELIISHYVKRRNIAEATKYWNRIMNESNLNIVPSQTMTEAMIDLWTMPHWKRVLSEDELYLYLRKAFLLYEDLRLTPRLRSLKQTKTMKAYLERTVETYPHIVLTNKFKRYKLLEEGDLANNVIEIVKFGEKTKNSPTYVSNVRVQYKAHQIVEPLSNSGNIFGGADVSTNNNDETS